MPADQLCHPLLQLTHLENDFLFCKEIKTAAEARKKSKWPERGIPWALKGAILALGPGPAKASPQAPRPTTSQSWEALSPGELVFDFRGAWCSQVPGAAWPGERHAIAGADEKSSVSATD